MSIAARTLDVECRTSLPGKQAGVILGVFSRPVPRFHRFAASCFALTLCALFCGAPAQAAVTSVEPITWNVIGLDSNNVDVGPNHFPVGARVCNDGTAVSNQSVTFAFTTANAYINLRPGTDDTVTLDLDAGECKDAYFEVEVTRSPDAYGEKRDYVITAGSYSTPEPRELFVERLISQNRNSVTDLLLDGVSISSGGTMDLMVGETYTITLIGGTATQGYGQIESFVNLPNTIFQVLSVVATYTADTSANVDPPYDKSYGDACTWDNNPDSLNYLSCLSAGKLGGEITVAFEVKVLQIPSDPLNNPEQLSTLIYDFSGSSYHYNSDYSDSVRYVKVVNASIEKSFAPKTIGANPDSPETSTLTFTITNPGSDPITGVNFVDSLPSNGTGGQMSIANSTVTYTGCGSSPPPSLTVGQIALSFTGLEVAGLGTCTIAVTVTVDATGTYDNVSENLYIGTIDTGDNATDTLVATGKPTPPVSCDPSELVPLATWTMGTNEGPPPPYTTIAWDVSLAVASASGSQSIIVGGGVTDNAWQIEDAWPAAATDPGPDGGPYFEFEVDSSNYGGVGISFQYDLEPPGDWASNANDTIWIYSSTDGTSFVLAGSAPATKGSWQPAVTATAQTTGAARTYFRIKATTRGNQPTAQVLLDNITINGCPRPVPTLSKAFADPSICTNEDSALTFTYSNPNSSPLTGVSFSDTLPTGLEVDTPNGTTVVTCASGSSSNQAISAAEGGTLISVSGAALTANSVCSFSVDVKGTAAGAYTNVSGNITSTESGPNTGPDGYGTADLEVVDPPFISKAFGNTNLITGETTSLTFSITNPNATSELTGVAFTDNLPGELLVATPNGLSGSCGGVTIGAIEGSSEISLAGATLGAGSSCTFSVNVVGTTAGTAINDVEVSSTNGCTGNTASASLEVREAKCSLSILKQVGLAEDGPWFSFLPVQLEEDVVTSIYYQFTVENTGDVPAAGVVVTDDPLCGGSACTCTWPNPLVAADAPTEIPENGPIATCVPSEHVAEAVPGTTSSNTATVSSINSNPSCAPVTSTATYAAAEPDDPTAVTIGQIELAAVKVSAFLDGIGAPDLDVSGLLNLLRAWDPAATGWLEGASRGDLSQALVDYLDPDGDGQVVLLRWVTLEERGTIGFSAERLEGGVWTQINAEMLPGMIAAPMGAEYWLVDPGARPADDYQYRLIEFEARGTSRQYGPFELRAVSAGE